MSQAMPSVIAAALPSDLAQFVRQQVASGRYQDEAEVVSQGVRLLQERENRLEKLRQMVRPALERLDRGEGIVLEGEQELDRFFEDIIQRGSANWMPKAKDCEQIVLDPDARLDLDGIYKHIGFVYGNYLILYRPAKRGIEVARAIHAARDLGPPYFQHQP